MNFANLNDIEFEYLCKDIMSKKLGKELRRFQKGKDGGIDLVDNEIKKDIVVQVKHYVKTDFSGLLSNLKKEVPKVKELNPRQYYVCCSKELTPQNIEQIYSLFSDYMDSAKNIISLTDINDFLNLEENSDILHRHFKLWIESTNILQNVLSNDISIDCEALFYNIESESKLFVKTELFEHAKELLRQKRILLLIGEPGVGKTITSKMLVLYFSTQGYRIRYSTDGNNLQSLKKSLAESPEAKEIILLDDCFGQAYYLMKETQENELLALIRHVRCHPNKKLLINSRITIFNAAKERSGELQKTINNNEFEISTIDIGNMPSIEKAKILYNHLYFCGLPIEYFNKIKENRFYWKIIKHQNYNPRIIEHFTTLLDVNTVPTDNYQQYILDCLSNPEEIWKNEFEHRLKKCDRFLVYTVYSLTNTTIPLEMVKRCYNRIVDEEPEIDVTIDSFEASLIRLQGSFFLKLVDKCGSSEISMLNPSINDFLDSYINRNIIEKIISKGLYIRQLYRLLSSNEADEFVEKILINNSILTYEFENIKQKNAFITAFVAEKRILKKEYQSTILEYISDPIDADLYDKGIMLKSNTILKLFMEPMCSFYHMDDFIKNEKNLTYLFEQFEFTDLIEFILIINSFFTEERDDFILLCQKALKKSLEDYCFDVFADEYDINVGEVAQECVDEDGNYDLYEIEEIIENTIESIIRTEVTENASRLPLELLPETIKKNNYTIYVSGVSDLIDPIDPERYIEYPDSYSGEYYGKAEIDYMFQ